jgi:hypothetical protein
MELTEIREKSVKSVKSPKCRVIHGYDTHVRMYPKEVYTVEDDSIPETKRLISVHCGIHHIAWHVGIDTKGLSGKEIAEKQSQAFE